jgi:multisubunit Na+/H+ antiporter MnhC subunit
VHVYTGTSAEKTALPYCSELCKERLIKCSDYTSKYGSKLTYLHRGFSLTIGLLVLIRMIIQYDNIFLMYVMSITLVGTGVTALIFPFAKLSECGFFGVKRTKIYMRIGGIALIIWAALIISRVNSF